ncbi:small-conductance mechanosensitive channel [Catenovulum agarivorans DS-2]|uniref:Small-conductance mechanosensitive channel n=1 Tax=Catenovulum agarivorans DS-2 TaxID=1328313 RepID=W7QJP5_9ALTE|nr:mechanosensitive ion channel domain-containing protein [Catenovulum agarivorans]EWH12096.1 small-conductance mechanosensitive channel [Catenovulum agarivorans DS-2]
MSSFGFLFTIVVITGYWLVKHAAGRLVDRIATEKKIDEKRVYYVRTVINLGLIVVTFILVSLSLGIDYSHLTIFFSSAFAVIGVAFFAQWSILSNVTASIIVYFFFPYKVGDKVKIVDGENSIEGKIKEITLFHVILLGSGNQISTYPNSLVFQKAVIIQPEERG